jgi:hypothetical protein
MGPRFREDDSVEIPPEKKLIPGLESGPILIAPRSTEGVVLSGV